MGKILYGNWIVFIIFLIILIYYAFINGSHKIIELEVIASFKVQIFGPLLAVI